MSALIPAAKVLLYAMAAYVGIVAGFFLLCALLFVLALVAAVWVAK